MVDKFTKYNKQILFQKWDGKDYYDNEYIKDNLNKKIQDGDYPTIDHKKSVKECFNEGILPIYVADLENLCITKRSINSKKGSKSDKEFKADIDLLNKYTYNFSSSQHPQTHRIYKYLQCTQDLLHPQL